MASPDPLHYWLEKLNLGQYYQLFIQHGLTTRNQCLNLDEDTLAHIGITLPGHQRRILSHLPTHDVCPIWDDLPSLPPKEKPSRSSYLFQDSAALGDIESPVNTPKPAPRPVPRPRTTTRAKNATPPGEEKKPVPAKRPTPAKRSTVLSPSSCSTNEESKSSSAMNASISSECDSDASGSHVVSVVGVCQEETSTDEIGNTDTGSAEKPCSEPCERVSHLYTKVVKTETGLKLSDKSSEKESEDTGNYYVNVQEELSKDLRQKSQCNTPRKQIDKSGKGKPIKTRELETFENAEYDEESKIYTSKLKADSDTLENTFDQETYGAVALSFSDNKDAFDQSALNNTDITNSVTLQKEENLEEYEEIWVGKRKKNNSSLMDDRGSSLMQFSPLKNIRGSRESFNMPPPAFEPPPLPTNFQTPDDVLSDFDPLSSHQPKEVKVSEVMPDANCPPIPPRPVHYRKSNLNFRPYENVGFPMSDDITASTLPKHQNLEPEMDMSSPPPIAYSDAHVSMTMDPFQHVDPFQEFTPDYEGFLTEPSTTKNIPKPCKSGLESQRPLNIPEQTVAGQDQVYDAIDNDILPPIINRRGVTGAPVTLPRDTQEPVYELAADEEPFDPFGLHKTSVSSLPRSISSASSGSSHRLSVVVPPPSLFEPPEDNTEDIYSLSRSMEDSDSNESLDMILDRQEPSGEHQANMGPVEILPSNVLSPRRRERSGYLYKQGGVRQNRGWRKRWVIFDGKSLRYYSNSKDQVSKRIVPLSCMVNVEMDVKPTNSRQFKFRLHCTNRVFLFATDNLDDCKMWASTLLEAILNYKKPEGGEKPGGDMNNPDIANWMKLGDHRLKYYVALKKQKLCYYQNLDDYNMASPLNEIDMELASVKEMDRTKLQLATHYSQFMLHFESSSDASNWKMALEESILEAHGDNTVLDQVKENPSNASCADCGSKDAHWASMNLAIVLCIKCAGIHRGFDNRLSKIRSLRMDTRVWNSSLVEMFKVIGNSNANKFWLKHLPPGKQLLEKAASDQRKEHIHNKYKERLFCDAHPFKNDKTALNEALLQAAQLDDVLLTMQILMSGADVLYSRPENPSVSAYELAMESHQRIQMEFLLQNGGDRTKNFNPGSEEASLIAKLRSEIQRHGYLLKTGSNMKDFLKRWCVLEHGHLSYYVSEESKVEKDRIDNDAILSIQISPNDKQPACFEISSRKNNRIYLFAATSEEERASWMQSIAQVFCPVNLMDKTKKKKFTIAGYVYMKMGFNMDWQKSWFILEDRILYFTDKNQQERDEDSVDLRKATSITKITQSLAMCSMCLESGPQFVINVPDRALYFQADLTRDTDRIYNVLEVAVKRGGDILEDQVLGTDDVPVMMSQCVNFIQQNGLKMPGIYREAAQNSKVQHLVDSFHKDARSVVLRMEDNTVHEVCNVLKRFLRNLDDPLLTAELYPRWIQTAGECDHNTKLQWYKYLLQQLPRINYLTLRALAKHLHQLTKYSDVNKMTLDNISIAFGSTLMKTDKAIGLQNMNPNSIGNAMQLEMKVISDIVTYYEWLFDVTENETRQQTIEEQIKLAEEKLKEMNNEYRVSHAVSDDLLIWVHYLDPKGNAESVKIKKHTTVGEVVRSLITKMKLTSSNWILHEVVKGEIERPLHGSTKLWPLVLEWQNWSSDYSAATVLCIKSNELKEKIESAYDPSKPLFAELKYYEKRKVMRMAFEFTQSKLSYYKDKKSVTNPTGSWNIEDLNIYKGADSKRSYPNNSHCFTFLVKGDKVGSKDLPYFGRTVCFSAEQDLLCWMASMMVAQNSS